MSPERRDCEHGKAPTVEARGLKKVYRFDHEEVLALRGVDFTVEPGDLPDRLFDPSALGAPS